MIKTIFAAALLAACATGTVILPDTNLQCNVGMAISCTGGVDQIPVGGLSFFLPGTDGIAIAGDNILVEATNGNVSGAIPLGTAIPYAYNMTLRLEGEGAPQANYDFQLLIYDGSTLVASADFKGIYSTVTPLSNSGHLTTTAAVADGDNLWLGYELALANTNSAITTVQVPEGASVDLGPLAAASVPEPASVALLGLGLAVLAVGRHKVRSLAPWWR